MMIILLIKDICLRENAYNILVGRGMCFTFPKTDRP